MDTNFLDCIIRRFVKEHGIKQYDVRAFCTNNRLNPDGTREESERWLVTKRGAICIRPEYPEVDDSRIVISVFRPIKSVDKKYVTVQDECNWVWVSHCKYVVLDKSKLVLVRDDCVNVFDSSFETPLSQIYPFVETCYVPPRIEACVIPTSGHRFYAGPTWRECAWD